MTKYKVIGLMSGTSLDGLDIAFCEFNESSGKWNYNINLAETIEYDTYWKEQLATATNLSAEDFLLLHNSYGEFLGNEVEKFCLKNKIEPDIISSHGHTIFHQPDNKFTFQIGNGASIASKTQITTVSDFRTLDVALNGQGAPLVPIGDQHLFSEYDYCLNLGGFANISFQESAKRIAFDICPCNMAINYMMNKINLSMDKDGEIAKRGFLDDNLLKILNNMEFYSWSYPKSLGKEWFDGMFVPKIDNTYLSFDDILRTIYEHITQQISNVVGESKGKILITGGGAYNKYLISLIKEKVKAEVVVPNSNLIGFKEALIFAFLGLLRFLERNNCLSSVTGASIDCSGGVIHKI